MDRKAKTKELLNFHLNKFLNAGIKDPVFIPKCAYLPRKGATSKVVAFFKSELKKGKDIYTEFVDRELNPETEERYLYKWKYNKYFEEEYESTDDERYLVPIDELEVVGQKENVSEVFPNFELMDPDTDAPLERMTIRDVAALLLRKKVSNKKWLNDLID